MASGKKKGRKRRGSLLSRIIFAVNILFSFLLLLSYLSPHVSPEWTTIAAFLGLAYPFLAIINIAFMLFWMIMFRLYFLLPALSLAIGYNMLARHIQFNPLNEEAQGTKVMSYNVRMFDFFDWKQDALSAEGILNVIRGEKPNILCIQEFYNNPGKSESILNHFEKSGLFNSYHVHYDAEKPGHAYGSATLSTYQIINKGYIDLPGTNPYHALYTDLIVEGDTLRVYNLHLVSYRFEHDDYDFFQQLKEGQETIDFKTSSRKLITKLQHGFVIRARQAHMIREHMDKSPYPLIICGDFNDSPASFAYRLLRKDLKDAFMEAGRGSGQTYSGSLPSFRIDYIFHDPAFESLRYETIPAKGSDHKPITSIIKRKD